MTDTLSCIPKRYLIAQILLIWLAAIWTSQAQFNVGLYRDGQLIETLGSIGPATNSALQAGSLAGIRPRGVSLPSTPLETQARNQAFVEAARIGEEIRGTLLALQPGAAVSATRPEANLAKLREQFVTAQTQARSALTATSTRLAQMNLPKEILARQNETIAAFDSGMARFTQAIDQVLAQKSGAIEKALLVAGQLKFRDEPDLTKRSPTRQAMTILQAPQVQVGEPAPSKESADRPFGTAKPRPLQASPQDLAETIDVQLTTTILAKAAALSNSPQAIYEFVRNNVVFQPYLGSRKGAAETLRQLAGNDTDQASLLLALLRAANVPCHYVRGTVEMTPQRAMNWVGVDDAATAGAILTTAGLNGVAYYNGTNVVAIRCTRVWVEAYVPYSNYRGVPNDDTGKTWIPLDPAFKELTIAPGQDALAAMGFNTGAFLANYVATFHGSSPIELLATNIQNFLNTNQPGSTLADVQRRSSILRQELGLLPASLPNEVLSVSGRFAELEDNKRFKVRFYIHDGGTTFIDLTTNLCQLAGHRVTIEWVGSTTNDQAVIDAHGGVYGTPPNLVQVRPLLKLDGVSIAVGANAGGMGYTHDSDMYFIQPAGDQNVQPVIYNAVIAGNNQSIGFDTFLDHNDPLLPGTPPPNSLLMQLLYSTAVGYLDRVDRGQDLLASLMGMVTVQDVGEAIVESSVSVAYSFGVPVTFQWTGLTVDADRRIIGPFAVNADSNKESRYMLLSGYDGSIMENRVFEDTYGQAAISAVKILELSNDRGIHVCYITNTIGACPGMSQSSSVVAAVNNALSHGHVVIIPERSITVSNWSGTGYIDLDPATGAAGYIISGGISGNVEASGGATVETWSRALPCEATAVTCEVKKPAADSPDPSAMFCAEDTNPIKFETLLHVTCKDGSTQDQPWNFQTSMSIKAIADGFGAGDYELTVYALGAAKCTRKLTIFRVQITASGDYIVPGSSRNRIEYRIEPSTFTADSGQLELLKGSTAVRTLTLSGDQLKGGDRKLDWNGKDSGGQALKQSDSPFIYKLTINKSGLPCSITKEDRRVEEKALALFLSDKPKASETLVTGIDEATITPARFEVKASFHDETDPPLTIPKYDIDNNVENPDGPSGNEWAARVWLKKNDTDRYIFYTTPSTPVNIRYDLVLQSKGDMVRDGVLNKWDMDDTTTDFETKGTLTFGVEPGSPTNPLREFEEKYEVVP